MESKAVPGILLRNFPSFRTIDSLIWAQHSVSVTCPVLALQVQVQHVEELLLAPRGHHGFSKFYHRRHQSSDSVCRYLESGKRHRSFGTFASHSGSSYRSSRNSDLHRYSNGGTFTLCNTLGGSATFTFNGTQVYVYGAKRDNHGECFLVHKWQPRLQQPAC
jgi:hypothetical protein